MTKQAQFGESRHLQSTIVKEYKVDVIELSTRRGPGQEQGEREGQLNELKAEGQEELK